MHHGINFTLRSELSRQELEHNVQRIADQEAEFWKSNSALIRSLGHPTRSINFVPIKRDDMPHTAFFAQCLLERLQDNHADFAKEAVSFLERLSKLLEARIVDSDPPSFFEGGKHIASLKQCMKLFSGAAKNVPKSLERPLKRASGLLHLLADADFMNPSFLEGVKLLHSLAPQSDKDQHLLLNFFLLNRPIADAVKDKRKKLATYLGLALTGLYGGDIGGAQSMLRGLVQFAREQNVTEYKEFSASYDIANHLDLFFNNGQAMAINSKVWEHIAFFAHYTLMAELSEGEEKQQHQAQAQAHLKKGRAINSASMNIALGAEYIAGRLFAQDTENGKKYIFDAIRSINVASVRLEEFIELASALEAALKVIRYGQKIPDMDQLMNTLITMKEELEIAKSFLINPT